MKKPKISLDSAKMKAFLLNHGEKIVLAGFVGAMLLIIWMGFSLEGLDPNKKPVTLISQSDQAMQFIDNPERWNEIRVTPPRIVVMDVVPRVELSQIDAEAAAYALAMQWNKPDFPKLSPRTDPVLFPPQDLIAIPIVGPLAVYARPGELDPLALRLPEDAPVIKRQPKKKPKLAYDDAYGGEGGMPGDTGMPQKKGKKGKAAANLAGEAGMSSGYGYPGGDSGGYGYSGGVGMPGMPFPQVAEVGFQPQAMEQTIARNVQAVTILATVPFQKQMEEYERTLGYSLDYDPNRDYFPRYLMFQVQRADVTADLSAEADALEWKSLGVRRALIEALGQPGNDLVVPPVQPIYPTWAGFPNEVVDPSYLQPGDLTHPAPPFLARDLWPLLVHPDVPLLSMNQYGTGLPGAAGATGAAAAQAEDTPPVGTFMPPGMGGMGGAPGMMGSPDGGGGFGGGFAGGMPGMGGGMPGMGGGSSMYGGGGGGYSGGGMYGGGSAGGYGSSDGGYGGYGAGSMNMTPPKYKMIRFTDMNVQPGQKYRYRLRVLVNDPNHPYPTMVAPSLASLHDDVRKRIKPLDDADAKAAQTPKPGQPPLLPGQPPPRSVYWIESPWSAPSAVVELPSPGRVFASKVTPASTTAIVRDKPLAQVPNGEPKADALAVAFDPLKVADIAVEQKDKVFRGSLLNFKMKEIKVIHPVTKQVITLPEEYSVATNILVADIMGGEKIPAIDRGNPAPLSAPGELLVFDSQGKLHVQNEAADIEGFRRFTLQKEDPKAATGAYAGDTAGLDGGLGTGSADGGRPRGKAPVRRGNTACN